MTAAFAALETRINAVVYPRLANVAVTLPSAAIIDGIFHPNPGVQLDMLSARPELMVQTIEVAALVSGQTVTVSGVPYTVRAIEHEVAGSTRLTLEAA